MKPASHSSHGSDFRNHKEKVLVGGGIGEDWVGGRGGGRLVALFLGVMAGRGVIGPMFRSLSLSLS